MDGKKLDRINELSRLAKERELTEAESAERQALRAEYLGEWRSSVMVALESTYIVDESGNKRKLKKKDEKKDKQR